jgi:hypothetical protein
MKLENLALSPLSTCASGSITAAYIKERNGKKYVGDVRKAGKRGTEEGRV